MQSDQPSDRSLIILNQITNYINWESKPLLLFPHFTSEHFSLIIFDTEQLTIGILGFERKLWIWFAKINDFIKILD